MTTPYIFRSIWHFDSPIEEVWQALTTVPPTWLEWWPGLVSLRIVMQTSTVVGNQYDCVWRSPTGYRLKLRLTVTKFREMVEIEFVSDGDLVGTSVWSFLGQTDSTQIDISWNVRTTKLWMNICRPVLKPLFIKNHSRIMHAGQEGLKGWILK